MITAMVWILLGIITAMIAQKRNRNVWYWLLIGFGTGLFGVLIIYLMDPLPTDKSKVPINKKAMIAIIVTCIIFGGVFAVSFYQGYTGASITTSPGPLSMISYKLTIQMGDAEAETRTFDSGIPIVIYNDQVYVHSDKPQRYALQKQLSGDADHVMYSATDIEGRRVNLAVWYPHYTGTKEFILIIAGAEGKDMKIGYTMVKAE